MTSQPPPTSGSTRSPTNWPRMEWRGAWPGVAGGVYARYAAFIHPHGVFAFNTSVYILLIPVIGGIGTLWGPVLGGVIFGLVEEQLVASSPQAHLLIYGALLILIILLEPGGILGIVRKGL